MALPDDAPPQPASVQVFDDPGRRLPRLLIVLVAAIASLGVGGVAVPTLRPLGLMLSVVCGIIATIAAWMRFGRWRLATQPLITLDAEGFTCRGLDRIVPWQAVERVRLAPGGIGYLYIRLSDMTILPRSRIGWRTQVSRRHRTVTLMGVCPLGMTGDGMMDLIEAHWRGARRRAAAEGDAAYSAILSEVELRRLLEGGPLPGSE